MQKEILRSSELHIETSWGSTCGMKEGLLCDTHLDIFNTVLRFAHAARGAQRPCVSCGPRIRGRRGEQHEATTPAWCGQRAQRSGDQEERACNEGRRLVAR